MQMSRIAPAFKTTIRTERVAGFMPQHNADACDKIFKGRGYHAVRGNSIFCSTNLGIASHWGSTYIIFPLNGFKMTAYMGEKEYMYDEIDRNGVDAAHRMDLTSNVDLALKHRSTDVLITGTGYIGVLYDYEHHQEELKYLIS